MRPSWAARGATASCRTRACPSSTARAQAWCRLRSLGARIFRHDPPRQASLDNERVVLILNAREPDKLAKAREWLELLATMPKLKAVALLVLGREDCNNDAWLQPYLAQPQTYKLRFVYLVYGPSATLDEPTPVFHWPLGL